MGSGFDANASPGMTTSLAPELVGKIRNRLAIDRRVAFQNAELLFWLSTRLRRPDCRQKTLDLLLQALGLLCEFAGRTENEFFNWLSFKRPPGGGALARPAET